MKALLRIAVVWNIPIACNRASADFMISSPLMSGEYRRLLPDYAEDPGVPPGSSPVRPLPGRPADREDRR